MPKRRIALALLAFLAGLLSAPAHAGNLVIYHDWSAPAEIAALNVLRGALESKGHRWIPLAIPHTGGPDADVLDLMAAGNAPNAFLEASPDIYRTLAARGRILFLDDQFAQSGALDNFPDVVRRSISVDGHIVKVPATIHADAMIYYNREVARAADVDPENWTSLDAMWADFTKVEAAGYQPMAIAAQPWQVGYLLHSLVASLGGPELYGELYGPAPNPLAFDDPALKDAFVWLRRFSGFADAGARDRSWHVATNAVITGQALLQLQGDWMKGEWRAADKTYADYGCIGVPGAKALPVTVDAWGLLGGVPPEVEAVERDFAALAVDPEVQADFARAKGSTPVRLDARETTDQCSLYVLDALHRPGFALPTPHLTASPDWIASVWVVAEDFWADPAITPEMAIAALRDAYGQNKTPSFH